MSRPTRGHKRFLPVRGCHPLWPDFPDGSGSDVSATGLVRVRSPLLTESRLMSFPPGTEMFQFPGFASHAYGFSVRYPIAGVGCPIRRSSDQSLLAAPQGLSQRATSFIASWRQGIHQMPLLSSAHPSDNRTPAPDEANDPARCEPALDARLDEFKQQLALQKALPPARRTTEPAYPCHFDTPTHRRKKRGRRIACQRPSRARMHPRP